MKTIGILCTKELPDGELEFACINPEKLLYVLTPDECPDDLLSSVYAIAEAGEYVPVGILIDAEQELIPDDLEVIPHDGD